MHRTSRRQICDICFVEQYQRDRFVTFAQVNKETDLWQLLRGAMSWSQICDKCPGYRGDRFVTFAPVTSDRDCRRAISRRQISVICFIERCQGDRLVTFALTSNVKETGFCDICLGNQGQICDFWSGYQRSRTVVERCQGDSCVAFAPPTEETDL